MRTSRYEVRKLPADEIYPLRTFGVYDTIGRGWVTMTLGSSSEAMTLAEAIRAAGLHNNAHCKLLVG
jgi:hypothetical protein